MEREAEEEQQHMQRISDKRKALLQIGEVSSCYRLNGRKELL